jgi:hypothetical protein
MESSSQRPALLQFAAGDDVHTRTLAGDYLPATTTLP